MFTKSDISKNLFHHNEEGSFRDFQESEDNV